MARPSRPRLSASIRGVLAISAGTLVGQVIIAAATPVLTRLYSPETFGAFSAVLAVASTIGPVASLKYDNAILLPTHDRDAKGVLGLAMIATGLVASLAAVATSAIGPRVFPGVWEGVPYASLWVGAIVATTGVFSNLVMVVLRRKAYGLVGWRSTIQAAATTAIQMAAGLWAGATTAGLLGGTTAGRVAGLGALVKGVRPVLRASGGQRHTTLAKRYWRSPGILTPSALLNALGSQLPLILVTAWFGSGAAGQLGMAQRLVFLPAALVGGALAQVFGAEIAQRLREGIGGARKLYLRATARIAPVAFAVGLAIALLAPWGMPWLLGSEWNESGYLAQAMAISVAVGLVVSPLSQVYTVHQSAVSLVVDLSRIALLGLGALIVSYAQLDVVESIWVLYLGQIINYIITWAYGLRIVSRR